MAYVSKTWVDRDSQYPTRRVLVHEDLSEEQVTVRRDEGIVTTQGDVFDANTMNNLEARIAAGIREKSILAGLDDTDISNPQNGQALIYDATSSKWVNANGGSGSATLAGLTDVTLTNPTADQVLKYDGTKWVNGAGGGDVELSKTVSGSVCSFSDGSDGLPVKDLVAQVVAVQSGTGDPSPSNVRPFSGWSETNVNIEKNILEYANGSQSGTIAGLNYSFSNGRIVLNGTTTGLFTLVLNLAQSANLNPTANKIAFRNNQANSNVNLYFRRSTTNVHYWTMNTINREAENWTDTGNENVDNVMIQIGSNTTLSNFVIFPLLCEKAYTPTTVTVAFGQTVYGAEVKPSQGTMTIKRKMYIVDGSETYTFSTDRVYFFPSDVAIPETSTADLLKCSHFKSCAQGAEFNDTDNAICKTRSNQAVMFKSSTYTTSVADFVAYAQSQVSAGTPITIIYDLATPITVQLTPTEIQTLLGNNTIWADTGDTTVTYYTSSASEVIDLVQYDTTKQDKLTEGTGISIDANNVISATGGGGGAVIDDTTTSTTSVWSSSKTSSEIEATAAQILVPEFSASKSYRDDDLCLHDGKFYMAITDIPAGAWDATKWAEQTLHDVLEFYSEAAVAWADIDDLGNVQVDNLANGQVLKYNSTTQRWENANESGGGASALNDLSDVSVPSPTAGQVLTYQIAASVGEWVASSPPVPWFELTGTIPAAQDPTNPDTVSLAFRDSRITSSSTVDVYTSVLGKNYVSLQVVTGRISVSYVTGQSSFEVKVRVS